MRYEQQAIIVNQSEPDKIAKELTIGMSEKIAKGLAAVMANATKQRQKDFGERLELYKQQRPYREAAPRW